MSVRSRHPDPATLSLYHDGEGAEEMLSGVAEHLDRCQECRAEIGRLRIISDGIRDLPDLRAPVSVLRGVHEIIAPPAPVSNSRWHGSLAALVIVGVILAIYAFTPPADGPRYEVAREETASDSGDRSGSATFMKKDISEDAGDGMSAPAANVIGDPPAAGFTQEDQEERWSAEKNGKKAARVTAGAIAKELQFDLAVQEQDQEADGSVDAITLSQEIDPQAIEPQAVEQKLRSSGDSDRISSKRAKSAKSMTSESETRGERRLAQHLELGSRGRAARESGDAEELYFQWKVVNKPQPQEEDEAPHEAKEQVTGMKTKSATVPDLYLPVRIPRLDSTNLDALARHLYLAMAVAAEAPEVPAAAEDREVSDGGKADHANRADLRAAPQVLQEQQVGKDGDDALASYGKLSLAPSNENQPQAILELQAEPMQLLVLLRAARAWEDISSKKIVSEDDFFGKADGFDILQLGAGLEPLGAGRGGAGSPPEGSATMTTMTTMKRLQSLKRKIRVRVVALPPQSDAVQSGAAAKSTQDD